MAAIEITLSGVLYDKYSRTVRPVVLIGEASLTGVGVGGGPIEPPPGQPGVWPPPQVSHPIVLPGDPSWGPPTYPAHPIALPGDPWWPKPPDQPPPDQSVGKPPPPDGGWGWHPDYGWGYFPGGGGKPQPGPGPAAAKK